jgi:hypothetical protein
MVEVKGTIFLGSRYEFAYYELDDLLERMESEIWDSELTEAHFSIVETNKRNMNHLREQVAEVEFSIELNKFTIYEDHKKIEKYVKRTFEELLYNIQESSNDYWDDDDDQGSTFELVYINFEAIVNKDVRPERPQQTTTNNDFFSSCRFNKPTIPTIPSSPKEDSRIVFKDILTQIQKPKVPPKEVVEKISTRRSIFIVARITND